MKKISKESIMFTIEDAIYVCNKIVEHPINNFSGIAFAVYTKKFDNSHICSLRPSLKLPLLDYFLNADEFINYLNSGSELGGVVHDGFHMINEDGVLTASAQYFVPKPVPSLKVNEMCGIRYHSGLFGSVIYGIKFIVTISSNKTIYIFENGKIVYEKKSKDYREHY